jgi:DNA polymerase-3 subunit epsilon
MLYLYSGKTEDDLKNFALQDLGIIRTNKNTALSARFTDAAEARACCHYSRLLDWLETNSEDVYRSAIPAILGGPECTTDYASHLRNKVAHRVGLYFESNTRAHLLCSCVAPAPPPTAMSALRGFSMPATIRSALRICSARICSAG